MAFSSAIHAVKRAAQTQNAFRAFVLLIGAGGILLMVLPAELLQYEAPEKPVINLNTTFSTLSSQGWLALAFTALAFGLMVMDLVGETDWLDLL